MRFKLLVLMLAGFTLTQTGCQTHMHAGGGRGFDAGASIGPQSTYYIPPPAVEVPPPVDPLR